MFWTDWGLTDPKIERAHLTGNNRVNIFPLGYSWFYVFFPMSVVIDYEAERIYWMDAYDNYIDSADLDGQNVDTIHYISENIFPADLALYGDNLYWVDWNSQSIQWFNRTRPLLMQNFGHLSDVLLTGVVVSDESRQPVGNFITVLYQITCITKFLDSDWLKAVQFFFLLTQCKNDLIQCKHSSFSAISRF